MKKISNKFERWLDKEIDRLTKIENRLEGMTTQEILSCCDHHAVHESEVRAELNGMVKCWNKYLEFTGQVADT